jgi:plasmid stabilization system protein ParE
MKLRLIITPGAEDDLRQAVAWHETVRAGLGRQFEQCFEAALARIVDAPLAHRELYRYARRVLMRPFKYHVYYALRHGCLYIAAVVHASRHPRVWQRRVRRDR